MNRYFGILMIYVTRPMCWLVALMLVAVSVFACWIHSEKYESYESHNKLVDIAAEMFLGYQKRVNSLDTLTTAVEASDGRPVRVDYGQLAVDLQVGDSVTDPTGKIAREFFSTDEVVSRLKQIQFPATTHSLATSSWMVQQSTIDQIGQLSSLKHLKFGSAESDFVSMDLSPLIELEKLISLDLGGFTNVASLAPLQQLPNLETLTIGNHQLVTTQTMRQVAAIKSLRQVFLPDISHNAGAMAALEELNQSSLDQVNVAIPVSDTKAFQTIANAIPDVSIRPSVYLPTRRYACLIALWAAVMLNFLGTHFSAMVTLPAAELTPGYRAAQRRTAWAIMIVLICAGAGLMWCYRVHPGLSLTLMSTALLASISSVAGLQKRATLITKAQRLRGLLIVVLLVGAIGSVMVRPLATEHFLVYPPLWVMIVLSLTTAYFAMKLNRQMGAACRGRIAVGNTPILSFFDMQEASLKMRSQRLGDPVEPYERGVSLMAGIGWIVLLAVLVLRYAPPLWFTPTVDGVLRTQLPMVCFLALMLVGVKWWRRMPFLATMATRPPIRQTQINQIFWGVAVDFARTIPLLIAVSLLFGSILAENFSGPVAMMVTAVLLVTGAAAMTYAFTLWMLTVRSVREIIVTFLIVNSIPIVFSLAVGFFVLDPEAAVSGVSLRKGLAIVSAGMIAIGVAATAFTWRLYQNLEWARYLP